MVESGRALRLRSHFSHHFLLFYRSVLVFYALIVDGQVRAGKEKKNLTIGGLYATGAIATFQNASGILKTVDEAIEYINAHSEFLPGYHLNIQWRDTKVSGIYLHVTDLFLFQSMFEKTYISRYL